MPTWIWPSSKLSDRGVAFQTDIPVDCMIKIPSAALMVTSLLRQVDFLSVGTNDLIQYTLAVDRSDDAVGYLYQPTHPAVFKTHSPTFCATPSKQASQCRCAVKWQVTISYTLVLTWFAPVLHAPIEYFAGEKHDCTQQYRWVEKQVWQFCAMAFNKVDDLSKLNQLEAQPLMAAVSITSRI